MPPISVEGSTRAIPLTPTLEGMRTGSYGATRQNAGEATPPGVAGLTPCRSRGLERPTIRRVDDSKLPGAIALSTEPLILVPLMPLHEAEHALASGSAADALRDTRAAESHWQTHGFGPWAIRDAANDRFVGVAELHLAGEGIEGIAPTEVEAGWWVTESRRNQGIATAAMQMAIGDLLRRRGIDSIAAYIAGENEPSRRVAEKLGFVVRGEGRGRFGEPMTVYELRRSATGLTGARRPR